MTETADTALRNRISSDTDMSERDIVVLDLPEDLQPHGPCATTLPIANANPICLHAQTSSPQTTETAPSHRNLSGANPSTLHRTRPQRQAAVKARSTLSTAYEPLIIHAAHSECSSSDAQATDEAGDVVVQKSGMLVIDDMLPRVDESEGDSDGYESTGAGDRKRPRVAMKRKKSCKANGRATGRTNKALRLDGEDRKLIARAALGVLGEKESKRVVKKKGGKEGILTGLKRLEAEKLVSFIEENVEWELAALSISEVRKSNTGENDRLGQAQPHPDQARTVRDGNILTGESLKHHWKSTLSTYIVNMYQN